MKIGSVYRLIQAWAVFMSVIAVRVVFDTDAVLQFNPSVYLEAATATMTSIVVFFIVYFINERLR